MNSDKCIPTRRSLLSRLRRWDDQDSWKNFFDTYWKLIFGVARKAGLSEHEAEDVVQETVISVAKTMPRFQYKPDVCSFKGWLLHLTRRRIVDQLRKRPREVLSEASSEAHAAGELADDVIDPAVPQLEAVWEEEWRKNLMEAALERLKAQVNPRHFQIFYLNVIKSIPSAEVADALGVTSAQVYLVRHRLTRQFKKLVHALERNLS